MAQITMKEMLDAGVHFGHQTQRWNPKMKPYVFGERGGIHIIDLQKTVAGAQKAAEFAKKIAADGGRVVFVGTKKQAVEPIQEAAKKCGQYFITKRWLGGTLTNYSTIKASIDRLKKLKRMKENKEFELFTKKERATLEKELLRLTEYLEGIYEMPGTPSALFVVDLVKEHIAIAEAKRLGIPVIGIADTNSDPATIEYPIPGNDDAIRSIKLFSNLVAEAYLEGAAEFKLKKRADTDKASDQQAAAPEKTAAPHKERKGKGVAAKPTEDKKSTVVVTKRKLVAAGLADTVEIEKEIEEGKTLEVPTEE